MSVGAEKPRQRPRAFVDDWASPGTPRPPTSIANPLGAAGRVEEQPLRRVSVGARFRAYGPEELAAVPSVDGRGGIDLAADGLEVAFAWDRSETWQIYTAPLVGDRIIQLTDDPRRSRAPRWSPDGQWVAFLRDDGDGHDAIWLVDRDGARERRLAGTGTSCADPAWSPDGSRIAVANDAGETLIVEASSGESRALGAGRRPRWSPDGQWLVVTTPRLAGTDLALVRADGSAVRELDTRPGADSVSRDGAWSPDGSLIAFVADARGISEVAFAHLRDGQVSSVEGCGPTPFYADGPVWRPDGRGVVYRHRSGADLSLCRVFTVSHADDAVMDIPGVHRSPCVAPDSESVVAVLSQSTRPADVVLRAKGAIEIARVTASLPGTLDPGTLVDPIAIRYGSGLTALVYLPLAEAGDAKDVVIYEREADREWDPLAQLLAARGHVVIAGPVADPSEVGPLVDRIGKAGTPTRTTRHVAAPPTFAYADRVERSRLLADVLSAVEDRPSGP